MRLQTIESIDDPRLDAYRQIRHRNLTRYSLRFIAESKLIVERLLKSDYETESILVEAEQSEKLIQQLEAELKEQGGRTEQLIAYCLPKREIESLIGFNFHRGLLGCGIRKPFGTLDDLALATSQSTEAHGSWIGACLVGIEDPENLGGILRSCSALGVRDVVLGPGTCDAFSRRVLRVSMGFTLSLRFYETHDLGLLMRTCRSTGVRTLASTLQSPATSLHELKLAPKSLLLLGNEAHGLDAALQSQTDIRVTIPMHSGIDSLNVSVAAGILLYYLKQAAVQSGISN